jgi:hypothetical protein
MKSFSAIQSSLVLVGVFALMMYATSDEVKERQHDAEVTKDAIKTARIEAAENKRIEAALAKQGAYMTGFQMVQK